MKKTLLTALLACLAVFSVRADKIWTETFTYPDGDIRTNSGGLWTRSSGSGADAIVRNGKLENSATGGNPVGRQDDEERRVAASAGSPYTNGQQTLYASYIINVTNFPNTASTYFTHFIGNGGLFMGKIFALTNTSNLPYTWRLASANGANTPNTTLNIDLATNVDYQVVESYDPVNGVTKVWVNPLSSSDPATTPGDLVSAATLTNIIYFYQCRQASSFGNWFCTIDNLTLATTFDEALTNTLSTNAVAPLIVRSPASRTNFLTDFVSLVSLAAGQGQASMAYQWQLNGTNITNPNGNGNTNVFTIASAALTDTGNYTMIATTPFGLSATSTVCYLWVTNPPIPPTITVQPPTNVAVYSTLSASFGVTAVGPPPLSYTWSYNGGALGPNVSGDGTPNLTITDVEPANGTAGAYQVVVCNVYGCKTSTVANVTVLIPASVSIAYLRSLVDPVNYLATNSTTLYQATGTVTTFTNLTTGNTSSYYLQDSTAGINIFATFASTFRPAQGDIVRWVGFLSSFASGLEMSADTVNNPATSYTVLSNNIATLPAPIIIPFTITNNLALSEATEGSIVILTNVYFGTNAGRVLSTTANTNILVSNANGDTFTLFFPFLDLDTAGQTLPAFASTVLGVFSQSLPNATTPRNQGYEVIVTRWSDIVTNPLAASVSYNKTNSSSTVTWPAAPVTYPYSVLGSTNVAGPYVSLTNKLRFLDTAGTYTDPNSAVPYKFYRLSVP